MKQLLTVLIPTSPIPSHPDTAILDETIKNIRQYTDAEIILMVDGVHESLQHRAREYEQYVKNVTKKKDAGDYGAMTILINGTHTHQAAMTRYALDHFVKTPLIMFCEHDTSPIGDIPLDDLCFLIDLHGLINCIRFNIFEQIPNEHKYLMIDKEPQFAQAGYAQYGKEDKKVTAWLTRTIQWSQRPHIAKTGWYRSILHKYFKPGQVTMIEDVMHSVVQTEYDMRKEDIFGLAIYTPEGNQLRSYHSDGRGLDVKIIEG